MSSFVRRTRHPRTGEFEDADWLDNYFGGHAYGVSFPSTGEVFREADYCWLYYDEPVKSPPTETA
jgi:hypothetical protein